MNIQINLMIQIDAGDEKPTEKELAALVHELDELFEGYAYNRDGNTIYHVTTTLN